MAVKISVIGDVMAEPGTLSGIHKEDGSYDFQSIVSPLKSLLCEADYRIANLETPLAGEEVGLSPDIFHFNAPDSIVTALQSIGINAVSTANNHAVDCGGNGFLRTLDTLDRFGMAHTGTYRTADVEDRNLYFTAGDTRFAMVAYTYGINGFLNVIEEDERIEEAMANVLRPAYPRRPLPAPPHFTACLAYIKEHTGYELTWTEQIELKKILGIPIAFADNWPHDQSEPYLRRLREDYEKARRNADVVLFVPHIGGQFNTEPGTFTEFFVGEALKYGFDAVIGAHSHTTQKAVIKDGKPVFYSLGNVTMSSKTPYSQTETLPNFGLVAHLYFENGKLDKTSYSVFKIVEDEGKPMRTVPVTDLVQELDGEEKEALLRDVRAITKRISGYEGEETIQKEYPLS